MTPKQLAEIIIANPFHVDDAQPGIVRGGWLDEMGGFLIGTHAEYVANALNQNAVDELRGTHA